MTTKRYLVFDIGCIECGEDSGIVGLFSDVTEADSAASAASTKHQADWHGQHSFEVYDLDDVSTYSKYR